jgi:predicted DCC family thiol-disulfide oxidoreductase YuxK
MIAGGDTVPRPLVFYDGGCPLCRREIAHYQRIDADDRLDWIDISREPERVRSYGLSVGRAMQRLHVLDAGGSWQTGVAGFVELWRHLPRYRYLASLVRVLRLTAPLDWLYGHWAAWRLKRRCSDQQCGLPGG